jgi:hypothetical protein
MTPITNNPVTSNPPAPAGEVLIRSECPGLIGRNGRR